MRIIADTNVLLRMILADDDVQGPIARRAMAQADSIVISLHTFCELAWVLRRSQAMPRPDIAIAIRAATGTSNVLVDRPAVEAGLAMLDAGGDFADGVIAYDGRRLGGATFVSFDKKAVDRLNRQGMDARLLV